MNTKGIKAMTIHYTPRLLLLLITAITLFASHVTSAYGAEKIAGSSAATIRIQTVKTVDTRAITLRAYLEKYNSPLAEEAETFVSEADKYDLDYKLLPAIAGVESWYGARIPVNSNNAWGYGIYGGNVRRFPTWKDAIQTISKDLRLKYIEKWGAKDIYGIGKIYASDPAWTHKVLKQMSTIEDFESQYQKKPLSLAI